MPFSRTHHSDLLDLFLFNQRKKKEFENCSRSPCGICGESGNGGVRATFSLPNRFPVIMTAPVVDVPPVVVEHDQPTPVDEYSAPALAVACAALAPVVECLAPAPAATCAAPVPAVEYVVPVPAVTYAALASVIEQVLPIPVDADTAPVYKYSAPALAVDVTLARVIEHVAPTQVVQDVPPAPAVFAAPAPAVEHVAQAPAVDLTPTVGDTGFDTSSGRHYEVMRVGHRAYEGQVRVLYAEEDPYDRASGKWIRRCYFRPDGKRARFTLILPSCDVCGTVYEMATACSGRKTNSGPFSACFAADPSFYPSFQDLTPKRPTESE